MKYCGTVSPFKGTRVYTQCAMGMPGSGSALEELLTRILGGLVAKGVMAKPADDFMLVAIQDWNYCRIGRRSFIVG